MAEIRPFRAWRYNEKKIQDIDKKFSPLFDVVTEAHLEKLYKIPNNSIHISVPKSTETAKAKVTEWKENGIIQQEELPAIYPYYQKFSIFGESKRYIRKGLIAMIKLPDFEKPEQNGIVIHESTVNHVVENIVDLLENTKLNIAPTHGIYEDNQFQVEKILDQHMQNHIYKYIDYQGVENIFGIIHDKKDIDDIIGLLKNKKVYLADGHHRLSASQTILKRHLQYNENLPKKHIARYHMMYLSNLSGDDLRILPIHRLIRLPFKFFDHKSFLLALMRYYDIHELSKRKPIYEEIKQHRTSFGLIFKEKQYILRLKADYQKPEAITMPFSPALKALQYTNLHYFALDKTLGIPYNEHINRTFIEYVKDYTVAIEAVEDEAATMAFIMNEVEMQQMMEICDLGETMPPKSTFFHPKVLCGMAFASINENENNSNFDLMF